MRGRDRRSAAEKIGGLAPLLVDDFARNLLTGARRVLADTGNPIRLHMFASAVRELFSYTLHYLAPDDEVKACVWFKQHEGTDRPTRRQRVQFAIHGGLAEDYVAEKLYLEVDDMCSAVIETIETLNKYTHVRPDTNVEDAGEIAASGERTLLALVDFIENIVEAGGTVAEALEQHVHDAAYDALAGETLPELDQLASHYSVESYQVEEISVTRIASDWIFFDIEGSVTVNLQWGSNSDIRNDNGAVGQESFPFEATLRAPVKDPQKVEREEDGPAAVDTSSWWENYHDPEDDFRNLEDGEDDAKSA